MLQLPAGREASLSDGALRYEPIARSEPSFTNLSEKTILFLGTVDRRG
jgi:hypothetical protein